MLRGFKSKQSGMWLAAPVTNGIVVFAPYVIAGAADFV
jgi:hypothetical protein